MRKTKLILLILVFPVVMKTLNIITYMKQLIMGICKQLRILFESIPFIKKGANVNARDKDGGAPLPLQALFVGKVDTAKILIDNRNKGFTPLHAAAREGYTYIAKFLISKGADVNAKSCGGTPLEFAVMYGYKETAKFLISKGADVNVRDHPIFDRTLLHVAASGGYTDTVKLLIDNGADVNARDKIGETPLHVAAYANKFSMNIFSEIYLSHEIDTVKLLIDNGADVNAKDKYGETPLQKASEKGHTDTVKLLIDNGADINFGILSRAAENGHTEIVKLLMGVDRTALHEAALFGGKVVKLLIDNGADVNARDEIDDTPLHSAAFFGHTDTVKLLIDNGADVNAKNKDGETPLHTVSFNTGKARLLIDNGADVNAKDKYGETPLTCAIKKGQKDTADLLRKHGARE